MSGAIAVEPSEIAAAATELVRSGRSVADLVVGSPRGRAEVVAAAALLAEPEVADALLDALFGGADPRVALAGAVRAAQHMAAARALVWSARLREAGLGSHCPLLAGALDLAKRPSERARRAAIAWRAFGDVAARGVALEAAAEVRNQEAAAAVAEELAALAPDLHLEAVHARREAPGAGNARRATVVVSIGPDAPPGSASRWAEVVDDQTDELVVIEHASGPHTGPAARRAPSTLEDRAARCAGARGEVVVLVDGSLHPVPGWLDHVVATVRSCADLAAVAPVVRRTGGGGGEVTTCGVELVLDARFAPRLDLEPRQLHAADDVRAAVHAELQAASGEAAAFRADVLRRAGGLDPTLAEPFATADACLRAGALGWRVGRTTGSVLTRLAPPAAEDPGRRELHRAEFAARWQDAVGPDRVLGGRGARCGAPRDATSAVPV